MHAIGVFEDSFKIEGINYSITAVQPALCIDVGEHSVTYTNL